MGEQLEEELRKNGNSTHCSAVRAARNMEDDVLGQVINAQKYLIENNIETNLKLVGIAAESCTS